METQRQHLAMTKMNELMTLLQKIEEFFEGTHMAPGNRSSRLRVKI